VDEDYLTEFTDQGLQFGEQWSRALEVDPQVVMVTQWNEWLAQLKQSASSGTYAGRPIQIGDPKFVDVFSREFNRDIAPMKGGYTDNYYYQLVSNVRKFKGMEKPQSRPSPTAIRIDGKFDDWEAVSKVYTDPVGDTLHRNFVGTDLKTIYTNESGRNDIVECKVVSFGSTMNFRVKTADPLTPQKDSKWMMLFVDADQNPQTGWEGYDLLLNRSLKSATETSMEKWTSRGWKTIGSVMYAYAENQLELCMPLGFNPKERPGFGFDFKWADNPGNLKDMSGFFLDGDAAPDRRFNYRF